MQTYLFRNKLLKIRVQSMGKLLIIKDADFEENSVETVSIEEQ